MRGEKAVVCGASMAGLLAARVLSDFYESVVVVERDVLPEEPQQRRGVSQGHHLHNLMSRGSQILGDMFPGLFDELATEGANVVEGIDPSRIYMRFGEHLLMQSGEVRTADDFIAHLASRPLLEARVRRRVRAIANVTLLDGHELTEPVLAEPGRVNAVRVADRASGEERVLNADLVVDATGQSARIPALLDDWGYDRPVEQRYAVDLRYTSQLFRVPQALLPELIVLVGPTLERQTGAGLLALEKNTVILTIIGVAGKRLPTDRPAVMAFADDLLPPHITAALRASEPLGDVTARHYPTSVWRRYDKMRRFPDGYLVIGDAVCSFNPVYGQGMTSAAMQAEVLHRCLGRTDHDLSGGYFRGSAKRLRPIWQANRLNDFMVSPADDWSRFPKQLLNWYVDKVFAAAAKDMAITEAFVRMLNLLDPPTALMHPSLLRRVIAAHRRRAA